MFQDPGHYSKLSEDHSRETKWVMDKCWNQLEWGSGEDILDVGCGPGDALLNAIFPALPSDFNTVIGIDASEKMIKFASKKIVDPRFHFQVMDISTKKDPITFFPKDIQENGGFHKITSFFCLQWVRDRKQMLDNLFQLLRPEGYAVLHLVVRSGVYNLWDKLAVSEKWKKYFTSVSLPFNQYVYMDDPKTVFSEDAKKAGFDVLICEVHERNGVFASNIGTEAEIKIRLRSVDPLVGLLPPDLQPEYLDDLYELVKEGLSVTGATNYTGLLVLLRKP